MIALGNDVVDIDWDPKNGNQYFDRLASYAFSIPEQHQLSLYLSTNEGIMLLWSIKEACYKSAVKLGHSGRFNPREFSIRNIEKNDGFFYSDICQANNCLKGRSVIEEGKIHSITISKQHHFEEVKVNDERISSDNYNEQHQAVRNLLRKDLSFWHDGPITFSKNVAGVPFVLADGEALETDISFSHHGKVVGYALTL